MSISPLYKDFLIRMEEYRKSIRLTQAEFGRLAGVTQSQISKQKKGQNVVTFEIIDMLDREGCDINYLMTGKRLIKTELDKRYEQCLERHRRALFYLMLWSVEQGLVRQGIRMLKTGNGKNAEAMTGMPETEKLYTKLEYLRLRMQDAEAGSSVWCGLRKAHGLSQRRMAEAIKVDIKKYSLIERGETKPDAEILLIIYELWEVAPNVILERGNGDMQELNMIWRCLTRENKIDVLRALEFCSRLFLRE